MPLVSVIIPTYNRANRVIEAIESVIDGSYKDFELIVIDDCSTDKTESKLHNLIKNNEIIYHRLKSNRGVSAARNAGISISKGKYIAFLDSDDIWMKEKLKIHVEYMENNLDIQISQVGETWIRNGKRVNPMKKHQKPSGDIFIPSLKLCLVSPSAVMIRRSLFNEVGLFDENLPACEDYDLWLRISKKHPILLLQDYLIEKRGGHPDQLSTKYWGMDRFRIKAMEKHLGNKFSKDKKAALLDELKIKSKIVAKGALKRKNYLLFLKYYLKNKMYGLY